MVLKGYTNYMSQLLIANWKANKNAATTKNWFEAFKAELERLLAGQKLRQQIVIAPSFPLLALVRLEIDQLQAVWQNRCEAGAGFELGIQDISQYGAGSYTGAVAGQNLAWLKPSTVILGHSERRRYFQETDQSVAAKIDQVLDLPARPIICVDQAQIKSQAQSLGSLANQPLTVAYEPTEAIGTGKHPGVAQVTEMFQKIRSAFGSSTKCLYGGSVDELTILEYLLVSEGAIIGTAALDGTQFARVVAASQAHP